MKIIAALLAVAFSLGSCAQMNKAIVNAKAFYTIPIPGTIPLDDAGQPLAIERNKVYSVFLEVKENATEWTRVWTDNKLFNVIPLSINSNQVVVGITRGANEKIVMQAVKGNTLLRLDMSPNDNYQKPPQTILQGELLLEGKRHGKSFYHKIVKVTELASPEYQ